MCVKQSVREGECGEHSNNQSGAVIRFGSLHSLLNLSSIRCNRESEPSCIFMKQGGHNQRHTHLHTQGRERGMAMYSIVQQGWSSLHLIYE